MKRKSAFTLLELIVVMVILSLLFVVLLRTYNRISTMTFRVQQEKEVNQELLQISQIMQNFSERNDIDHEQYASADLNASQGITDVPYLSGQDGRFSIFASGDACVDPAEEYSATGAGAGCSLFLSDASHTVQITNPKKISLSKVYFKVIPFASDQQYLDDSVACPQGDYLHCFHAPGFRVILSAYSANYGIQRATHVRVPFQEFF